MDKKDRITRFKSCQVGKGRNVNLRKEIEKLPEDMRRLWTERNFRGFLTQFSSSLDSSDHEEVIDDLKAILPFLSELSMSYDREIHLLIDKFYLMCKSFAHKTEDKAGLMRTLARSSNNYLRRTITENRKICPASKQSLELSTDLLEERDINEQTFHVKYRKDKYSLLGDLLDFIKKLYYYPLELGMTKKESFPSKPGVYLIFYIGENELYPGSQVDALLPVYVGKSETQISDRLYFHHSKIKKAQNLEVTDFVVQFIVTDKTSAGCIESKLIEHFSPIWNSIGTNAQTPRFSFGGRTATNLWNRCHIQADKETLDTVVERLSIKDNGPRTEA